MMSEIKWIDIKGYEGLYEISNTGVVKSKDRVVLQYGNDGKMKEFNYKGYILKPYTYKGYERITLSKNNKQKRYFIHQLVLTNFIGEDADKKCIDHIDGNPSNNNITNLRWVTYKENNNNPVTLKRLSESLKGKHRTETKQVEQCDFDWNVINTFESLRDARRNGFCNVRNAIYNSKTHIHNNYKWRFKE